MWRHDDVVCGGVVKLRHIRSVDAQQINPNTPYMRNETSLDRVVFDA